MTFTGLLASHLTKNGITVQISVLQPFCVWVPRSIIARAVCVYVCVVVVLWLLCMYARQQLSGQLSHWFNITVSKHRCVEIQCWNLTHFSVKSKERVSSVYFLVLQVLKPTEPWTCRWWAVETGQLCWVKHKVQCIWWHFSCFAPLLHLKQVQWCGEDTVPKLIISALVPSVMTDF